MFFKKETELYLEDIKKVYKKLRDIKILTEEFLYYVSNEEDIKKKLKKRIKRIL